MPDISLGYLPSPEPCPCFPPSSSPSSTVASAPRHLVYSLVTDYLCLSPFTRFITTEAEKKICESVSIVSLSLVQQESFYHWCAGVCKKRSSCLSEICLAAEGGKVCYYCNGIQTLQIAILEISENRMAAHSQITRNGQLMCKPLVSFSYVMKWSLAYVLLCAFCYTVGVS